MKVEELQMLHNIRPLDPSQSPPIIGDKSDKIIPFDRPKTAFSEVLRKHIQEQTNLKFSSHALDRISEREIQVTASELDRLQKGFENIKQKGGNNSLILIDDSAYIVSIKNQTVITALSKENSYENVFTEIDSVAIM
jgi:flagellar operon protein